MRVDGLGNVFAALNEAEKKIKTKGAKKGMNAATKIVARAAKDQAKKVTGLLKKSIGRKTKVYRNTGVTVGLVGARVGFGGEYQGRPRDPSFYSHRVEMGTQPHAVGKGSSLRGGKTKEKKQTGRMHPGAKAQPFLKPAFTQNASRIKDAIAEAIKEVLA